MLKICGSSIYKPLEMIFKQCIGTGVFPSESKKGNIVPIHKKGDKQTLKNYRSMSLLIATYYLPKCLNFFIGNKLFSSNQSGFKPGDSCINHLLSIIQEIYKSFNVGLERLPRFVKSI